MSQSKGQVNQKKKTIGQYSRSEDKKVSYDKHDHLIYSTIYLFILHEI